MIGSKIMLSIAGAMATLGNLGRILEDPITIKLGGNTYNGGKAVKATRGKRHTSQRIRSNRRKAKR